MIHHLNWRRTQGICNSEEQVTQNESAFQLIVEREISREINCAQEKTSDLWNKNKIFCRFVGVAEEAPVVPLSARARPKIEGRWMTLDDERVTRQRKKIIASKLVHLDVKE